MSGLYLNTASARDERVGYLIGKRLLDAALSVGALALLTPLWLCYLPWLLLRGKLALRNEDFVGPGGRLLRLRSFAPSPGCTLALPGLRPLVEYLPRLVSVLMGDLSLVGPRPVTPAEVLLVGGADHPRFLLRPGVVCLWWLRRRSNIDYGSEAEADLEYLQRRSLGSDLAILGRALVVLAYGRNANGWQACHAISGIRLVNVSMDDLINAIDAALVTRTRTRIAFVNPDCVNIAARNPAYRDTLARFDWVCADGIGMKIAGAMLGQPVRQNLNGTDLFPRLCAALTQSGRSVFLLGARPGVADDVAQWAVANYPGLKLAGTRSGYFSAADEPQVVADIRNSRADVVLVAMGAPNQESWLERNLDASGAIVGVGVGGLFDFYAGRIPRAPLWLREIGGEWAYRLIQEPGRMWRRYLVGNWVFLFRIMRERLARRTRKEHLA